jgi:hypothetical protein
MKGKLIFLLFLLFVHFSTTLSRRVIKTTVSYQQKDPVTSIFILLKIDFSYDYPNASKTIVNDSTLEVEGGSNINNTNNYKIGSEEDSKRLDSLNQLMTLSTVKNPDITITTFFKT